MYAKHDGGAASHLALRPNMQLVVVATTYIPTSYFGIDLPIHVPASYNRVLYSKDCTYSRGLAGRYTRVYTAYLHAYIRSMGCMQVSHMYRRAPPRSVQLRTT